MRTEQVVKRIALVGALVAVLALFAGPAGAQEGSVLPTPSEGEGVLPSTPTPTPEAEGGGVLPDSQEVDDDEGGGVLPDSQEVDDDEAGVTVPSRVDTGLGGTAADDRGVTAGLVAAGLLAGGAALAVARRRAQS